jgi:hypothetical protein
MQRWADDLIEIADNPDLDPLDKRVRVDTQKWLMGKLAASTFGDQLTIGGDPNNPLFGGAVSLSEMWDEQLDLLEQQKSATQSFSASRLSIGPDPDADRNQRAHLAYRGGCPFDA